MVNTHHLIQLSYADVWQALRHYPQFYTTPDAELSHCLQLTLEHYLCGQPRGPYANDRKPLEFYLGDDPEFLTHFYNQIDKCTRRHLPFFESGSKSCAISAACLHFLPTWSVLVYLSGAQLLDLTRPFDCI